MQDLIKKSVSCLRICGQEKITVRTDKRLHVYNVWRDATNCSSLPCSLISDFSQKYPEELVSQDKDFTRLGDVIRSLSHAHLLCWCCAAGPTLSVGPLCSENEHRCMSSDLRMNWRNPLGIGCLVLTNNQLASASSAHFHYIVIAYNIAYSITYN